MISLLSVIPSCRSNSEGTEAEEQNDIQLYNVGDTVNTDKVEFTLDTFRFTDKVGLASDNWLKPSGSGGTLAAGEDNIFLWVSFRVKNLSKEKINGQDAFSMKADYNDGYIYDDTVFTFGYDWSTSSSVSQKVGLTEIKPLGEEEYYGYIKCSSEVRENRDAPLHIVVMLPSEAGSAEFAYDCVISEDSVASEEALEVSKTLNHLYGNLDFVSRYAGNDNGNGSLKFADSFIEELNADIRKLEAAELGDDFSETAKSLPVIIENSKEVVNLLIEMGETNSDSNVSTIKNTASETMGLIEGLYNGELNAYN